MQNFIKICKNFLILLLKMLIILVIWLMLARQVYPFLQHHITTIDPKDFMVCVIDKDHRLQSDGSYGDISYPMLSYVTDQPPCDTPSPKNAEIFHKLDWVLEQVDEDEWEVQFYMGYWDDPHIYHYRVVNNKIIPMWHAKSLELGCLFWAVIIAGCLIGGIFALKNKVLGLFKNS